MYQLFWPRIFLGKMCFEIFLKSDKFVMGGAYVGGYTWPAKRKLRVTQSENYLYKCVRAILHPETCHTCVCLHVLSGTKG